MTIAEVLLQILEDLGEDDFKKFKWYLCQKDLIQGLEGIPRSRLEKADRTDTVDQTVQLYCTNTADVTRRVLMKLGRNDLLERLSNFPEPTGPGDHKVPAEHRVPADDRLLSVRSQFIGRVSEAVLNQLLDQLLEQGVITDEEMESVSSNSRADKARGVIDMVRRKGSKASSVLIAALCQQDRCLSTVLNLS